MTRRAGLCLALALAAAAFAAPAARAQQDQVQINFVDVGLETFIKWVATTTRTHFIYTAEIKAKKVYILSPTTVPTSSIYQIFETVMSHNGFALIPEGFKEGLKVVRVVDTQSAKWQPATIVSETELAKIAHEYKFITQVMALKHVTARSVNNTLRVARVTDPRAEQVVGLEDSNTILITGFAPNVKRISDVIKLMDLPGPLLKTEVVKLTWASPEYLVPKLEKLIKPQPGKKAPEGGTGVDEGAVNLVSDPRINAVVIQAYPDRMEDIKKLIKELDIQPVGETGGIHIYQLKHHKAEDLEVVLNKLIQGKGIRTKAKPGRPTPGEGTAGTGAPGGPGAQPVITVVADKANNALVVTAEPAEWKEIRAIIEELDVRRPQVLIEVAIVEMSPSEAMTMGVELGTTDVAHGDNYRAFGATNFGLSQLVNAEGQPVGTFGPDAPVRIPLLPNPGSTGYIARPRGITIAGQDRTIFQIPIILQMLKQDTNIEILSMPRLLTNDNQQASIKVTEADPTIKQETTASGSTVNSFDKFEEAGTELVITPHISADNYLRLEINQKLEVFRGPAPLAGLPRPKVSRELKSSITIPDGQTVVMGGLIRSEDSETVRKIPVLGDIPLIGIAFRRTDTTQSKTRLYLFITPHILTEKSFKDLSKISYDHKLEAWRAGAQIGAFDPRFVEYQKRLGTAPGSQGLPPLYMLRYRSPTDSK